MRMGMYLVCVYPNGPRERKRNGSSRRLQPSFKGRSGRQTASTCVGELSIRYIGPFRTSPTDIYSYNAIVHMSIFSHPIMRSVQRHAIFATRALHRVTVASHALD